jgi:aspartate/methionine/tyrosine aminotransferase
MALNEGDEVLIPNCYPTYSSVTNLGAVPIYYNLTESSSWDLKLIKKLDLSGEVDVMIGYPYAYWC